jgi:hypothetical protein
VKGAVAKIEKTVTAKPVVKISNETGFQVRE